MARASAQARPGQSWLRCLALAAGLAPAPALAGAWIAPAGGQTIHTEVAGEREDGSLFLESQIYSETPIGEALAFVAKPWIETSETIDGAEVRGEAQVGLKTILRRQGRFVTAAQGTALWRSDREDVDCGRLGGEVRGLAGVSTRGGRAFVNAEAGVRTLEGGCARGRFDLTFGYRPSERWLALAEAFTDAPEVGRSTTKAQFSIVRLNDRGRGIQAGVRFDAEDPAAEPALLIGFWSQRGAAVRR